MEAGNLELVLAFVNTRDLEDNTDELASAAALGAWLRARGLLRGRDPSGADLVHAKRVREALRSLLRANNGLSVRKEAAATLDWAARRAGLSVRFGPGAAARHEPAAAGVDAALGSILAAVATAMLDGSWARAKACRARDCQWAFYDRARNRSRIWCSMSVCGNRTKARAYRRRRRAASAALG
jgi:predicted RNA-binding Zn ribbon-like protein